MCFRLAVTLTVFLLMVFPGCSVRRMAVNSLADALAESSSVYASDDDLELVREALPFGLKTIEALVVKAPRHRGLLLAAASGFTQYAYAFVQNDAEELRNSDPSRAREERLRAKRLFLRGRDYAFQSMEVAHPGFRKALRGEPEKTLAEARREDVGVLYWIAVAWAAAISSDKEDMDLVADLHMIEPLARRCLELDEEYDHGAIHEFLISFDGGRSVSQGGSLERALEHFEKARQLSGERKVGPLVSLAENVSVQREDRKEFERLLRQALAFDVNSAPEFRLANLVAQRRARLLLSQIDELFM